MPEDHLIIKNAPAQPLNGGARLAVRLGACMSPSKVVQPPGYRACMIILHCLFNSVPASCDMARSYD